MKPLILTALLMAFAAQASPTLIQDARVFDGERSHPRRSVLIDAGVIVDADFRGTPPAGATIVDGRGKTLLPGLIDAHVHAYRHQELPLLFGVTTQVDMFSAVPLMQDAARRMREGRNRGQADLFSAGTLVTAPGGHGTGYGLPIATLEGAGQAQAFIDARIAEGSHFIKIVMEPGFPGHPMQTLDLATVKAAIGAAHRRGKLAVVHTSRLADAMAALDAGADGLAHLFLGDAISGADIALFVKKAKRRNAFIIPTFSVLESMAGVSPADILDDPRSFHLLSREQRATLAAPFSRENAARRLGAPIALTGALHKAGVRVLAGTDAGNPGTQFGIGMHHEMAALVKAGLAPAQALRAATAAPAQAFRLGERGRIAKGYKADLLLVDGDPTTDIAHTRRIAAVWKDGEATTVLQERQRALVAAESKPSTGKAPGRILQASGGKLGAQWSMSSDAMFGGKSSVELKVAEDGSVLVKPSVAAGFGFPWAGLAWMPGAQPMQAADLGPLKHVRFRVRGDGASYNVAMMSSGVSIPVGVPFVAGSEWRELSIPLASFAGIDPRALTMLAFNAGPKPGAYQFELADVRLTDD